jgi:hypothetical protein
MYPEGPVKIGEVWRYQESLVLRVDSAWIKQKEAFPYVIDATSNLAGFVAVKGRRCAVIETAADQIQTQRFKILLKNILLYSRSKVRETTYLDYKTGRVMAKIVKTQTYTNSGDGNINDYSISQTISSPEE